MIEESQDVCIGFSVTTAQGVGGYGFTFHALDGLTLGGCLSWSDVTLAKSELFGSKKNKFKELKHLFPEHFQVLLSNV